METQEPHLSDSLHSQIYGHLYRCAGRYIVINKDTNKAEDQFDADWDVFACHYTLNIMGETPSQRFYRELRILIKNPIFNEADFWFLIGKLEESLLERELYEALALNQQYKPIMKRIINR